jgi:ribosomal protein S24E
MKYTKDFGYMSMIETVTDVNNSFLSRRELTCNFAGLGGKLKKMEAVDMVTKEFKLDDKVVIPMGLKTHVGKPLVTGIFYVYEDEALAKKHINPTIFARLDKVKAKMAEAAEEAKKEEAAEEAKKEEAPAKEESKDVETKAEDKPAKEESKEGKTE